MPEKRFFIRYTGEWDREKLQIEVAAPGQRWPAAMQRAAQQCWQEKTARNKYLYNGRLASLKAAFRSPQKLTLVLSETCYRDQLYSNACAGRWTAAERQALAARALGISAVVQTADSQIVLMHRSRHTDAYAGLIDVIGGHIEPAKHTGATGRPDVFAAILDEINTELGVREQEVQELLCISLLENAEWHKPELLFTARTGLQSAEMLMRAETAAENFEYTNLTFLPDAATALREFLRKHGRACTPSAEGCLFAYAQHMPA